MPNQDKDNQSLIDIFKTRIFSPIMSGFIISWLVINWEIPYATLFLSAEDIEPINKIDYIKCIIANYDCPQWELFWKPFLYAIVITLISPLLKYIIDYYIERIRKEYNFRLEKLQKNYFLLSERNTQYENSSKRIKEEFVNYLLNDTITFDKFLDGEWRVIFNPKHLEYHFVYYRDKKFFARDQNSKFLFECIYIGYNDERKAVLIEIDKRFDNGFSGLYTLKIEDRENLQFNSNAHGGNDIVLQRVSYYPENKYSGINI